MSAGAAGFWSYVHDDDEGDQGRIVLLSEQLKSQYRLATGGEQLDLFVDRDIKWGEEWDARIGDAIAGTTFFIPIVTPSYLKSQACRDELLKFVREAERLGLQQLVMPIYWRTVPALEDHPETSSDEAVRIIGRYQWKDFREARLEEEHLSLFRKAVDDLANELTMRAVQAEAIHDVPSTTSVPSGAGSGKRDATDDLKANEYPDDELALGLIERLSAGEDAVPAIVEIMDKFQNQMVELTRVSDVANQAYLKVQNAKAGLIMTERFARDLMVPAARIEDIGSEYAAKLAELGDGVDAQLELLASDDEPLSPKVRADLESMVDLVPISEELASELEGVVEAAAPLVRMSRSLRAPIRHLRTGLQGVVDGRTTISEWGKRAGELLEERDRGESEDDHS